MSLPRRLSLPRILCATCVVFVVAPVGSVGSASEEVLTPKDLIDAFSTTLSQIRTLQLTYRREVLSQPSTEKFQEVQWWRDDTRERFVRKWDAEPRRSDLRRFLDDTFIDRDSQSVKVLHCSRDRRLLSKIEIGQQHDFSGRIVPLTEEASRLIAYEIFLLRFMLVGTERLRTLAEQSVYSGGATLVDRTDVGGVSCYHLRMRHPAVGGKFAGSSMDFFLDPQHGFLIRKLVKHIMAEKGKGELHSEVKEFFEGENGVFFPTVVDRFFLSNGEMYQRSIVRVKELKINQPLDEEAFSFVFPKNLFVTKHEQPPGGAPRQVPVLLIGDNGEVARELKPGEFMPFVEEHYKDTHFDDTSRSTLLRILLGVALLLLIGGGWSIGRWLGKRR